MAKFTLTRGNTTVIPEDIGWKWCSEEISEPSPRYIFTKVAGLDGLIDMSGVATGNLMYDDRTIKVTFARFKKGQENWLGDVNTLVSSIRTLMGQPNVSVKYVYPKTEMYYYQIYGWDYAVSRDGIIQFITLTFRCKPLGTVHT